MDLTRSIHRWNESLKMKIVGEWIDTDTEDTTSNERHKMNDEI